MKKHSVRPLLILVLILDILLCGAYFLLSPDSQKMPAGQDISEASIQKICELSTLECYYHNVSDWSQPAYGILGYGAKKVWIEYNGIVHVGVRAGSIRISEPDQDGVITVTVPEAVILDKDLDEDSIYEITSDTTVLFFFNDSVNSEDRKKALANAQDDMEASAAKNEMILSEAKERAKKIIERNILAIGEASGKNYKVRFTDASGSE